MMEFEALRQTIANRYPHLSADERFDMAVASYEKTHFQPDLNDYIEACAKKLQKQLSAIEVENGETRKAIKRVHRTRIAGILSFENAMKSHEAESISEEIANLVEVHVHA